jgi:hypothetical protein
MSRKDILDAAAQALRTSDPGHTLGAEALAYAVVNAILPQVTTVEELEALPQGAAVSYDGRGFPLLLRVIDGRLRNDTWFGTFEQAITELGPLTVVWQP